MPCTDIGRWAVYWAPTQDDPLWSLGCNWLGRDPASNVAVCPPPVEGIPPKALTEATESPRFYGFHATLKPPFALGDETSEDDLLDMARDFAIERTAFMAPPLVPKRIGGFLALALSDESAEMEALAGDCVRAFDRFRAPQTAADLARRRAKGLTERQEEYLNEWGYPYVFEEFRFHMTVTGNIGVGDLMKRIKSHVAHEWVEALARRPRIDSICIYSQPDRETAFSFVRRLPFGH